MELIGEEAFMQIIDIHEAKADLVLLVEQAVQGQSFVIAKAGKPLVKVSALDSPVSEQIQRLGFMVGYITVPDDFDRMCTTEAKALTAE